MPSKRTCFSTHVCLIQANSAGELNLLRFFGVWFFFLKTQDAQHLAWMLLLFTQRVPMSAHCNTATHASCSSSRISWLDRAHRHRSTFPRAAAVNCRDVNSHRGKHGTWAALISTKPSLKNMRASALCAAFFTSNQIPLAACAGALSPVCF